jgi:small subunit ribosomal protein S13
VPRVVGVEIPSEKRIDIALRYIFGIGPTLSLRVLKEAGVEPHIRAKNLSEDELSRIAGIIDRNYEVEGPLRRRIQGNIARLRDIGCYRGQRHRRGLPVRGQRTRTNARTRKGPRKTVAGKKGVKEMHRG